MGRKQWEYVGDVNMLDYGGKFFRRVGKGRWHVVEVINMDEACGRDNEGRDPYAVELAEVDIGAMSEDQIKRARDFVGLNDENPDELWIVEALYSYGCKAPLGSWEGRNGDKLISEAKAESRSLVSDPDRYEEKMNAPVNAIGSSAREYMRGDVNAAIERGVVSGDPKARLMAKLQGIDQPVIDDARPADWMPYLMGYMDATGERPKETSDDLAPEYHLGYARGERVRKGEAPAPGWIKASGGGFRPVAP